MADAEIFDIPVELGLELMSIVSSDFLDAERDFLDDMLNEINCICLDMSFVDFESSDARGIIDSGILKASYLFARFPLNVRNLTSIWI